MVVVDSITDGPAAVPADDAAATDDDDVGEAITTVEEFEIGGDEVVVVTPCWAATEGRRVSSRGRITFSSSFLASVGRDLVLSSSFFTFLEPTGRPLFFSAFVGTSFFTFLQPRGRPLFCILGVAVEGDSSTADGEVDVIDEGTTTTAES